MWNFDKLFAINNIVCIKDVKNEKIYNYVVDDISFWGAENIVDWNDYFNENLSYYDFEIQYIIRLGENGEVVEHLFDRKKDVLVKVPELSPGMFGKILYKENESFNDNFHNFGKFIVGSWNKVVYQNGGYDDLDEVIRLTNNKSDVEIVEIYNARFFDDCDNSTLVWRNPLYQKFLDSRGEE